MGVCHRMSPRGRGLVTMTVTNPHLAPPMPVWGVVGHNIDRCITMAFVPHIGLNSQEVCGMTVILGAGILFIGADQYN